MEKGRNKHSKRSISAQHFHLDVLSKVLNKTEFDEFDLLANLDLMKLCSLEEKEFKF